MRWVCWWRGLGKAARFDLSVRLSFYANVLALPALAVAGLAADLGAELYPVVGLLAGHAVTCTLLLNAGIDHYLGRRPLPGRLTAVAATATVLGVLAGYLAVPDPEAGDPDGPANLILLLLAGTFTLALSTGVRLRVSLPVTVAAAVSAYALSAAQGMPDAAAALAFGLVLATLVITYRGTTWLLGTVWELDRSRGVQAGLAVAEERLRFARDLHDVVGRSLSVVAIKAELAAQLARRGRPDAVDEMLEVRRIAQESLAELRAVVSGYRAADLGVELAGARSLLASAGIECRVIGDGDRLPAQVQSVLGWAVREATTNVLRHSEARRCILTLRRPSSDAVTLTMDNDGVTGEGQVHFGNGLNGLAERMATFGGTVTAGWQGPHNFRLSVELPTANVPPLDAASTTVSEAGR